MSADSSPTATGGGAPPPTVKKGRMALVWLIPIVAGLYGVYLGVDAYLSEGPTIKIFFDTADGLEAGKTLVKYKDVEIQPLEGVSLAPARLVPLLQPSREDEGLDPAIGKPTRGAGLDQLVDERRSARSQLLQSLPLHRRSGGRDRDPAAQRSGRAGRPARWPVLDFTWDRDEGILILRF